MKSNKTAYIDFIIDCFDKGIVERSEVLAIFGEKWQTPTRTFDRYFKQAKEQHFKRREAIEKEKLTITITQEKKAVKSNIKTKEQLLEKLNEIIDQKTKKVEGQIIMPTFNDVKGAIDLYCKIEGHYAPTKVAETDKDGNNKKLPTGSKIFFIAPNE